MELKEQCREEWEESGGPHSWFVHCERAKGHEGSCRWSLSERELLAEGVWKPDIDMVIVNRRKQIEGHKQEIARLEAEIRDFEAMRETKS